ncbi:hypothetical protein JW813_04960 [Clostridium botulinum]|uniref:phage antirepressor N-terminal domain-containing protein n=1 Tax=Clostridium botulinum TaxID=1491 RepID=UPI0006C44F1B|nr:phage antirepressor N-terminal domain-containing protein [Clostridium botulinum]KAI3349064.1 phage antirepressor N-terminal domain-containing protein [Clostridium botulinum]KOM88038.1 hypothetical protein ACP51_10785 [Clostridium botulinum]KOR62028.1 hypothetical protein ADT22_05725 [Clostridium botulinum]UZP04359.1 hypothetical protein JW813_04960 [Clostridium botulinum]UZP07717.1 hypothetical protein JYA71_04955 [Clostridium botulinum]
MNGLIVKPVDFLGDELVAIKNDETGKIYTGVSYICRGIGLSDGQFRRQKQNLNEDVVLKKGITNLLYPTNGGIQEVLGIELDFLPLWLAKISITPRMKEEQPEVAEKLVNYQLKAKDVLAQAFIHNKPTCIEDILISSLQEMKAIKGDVEAIKQANVETKEEIQGIREITGLSSIGWKDDSKKLIVKIAHKLGGNQFIQDVYKEVYSNLEKRVGCQLQIRLTNKRRRMADEGICKSKRDKLNKLDIIGEDKKILECFLAIVKELAIKYGV